MLNSIKTDNPAIKAYMNTTPLGLCDLDECLKLDQLTLNGLWSKKQWEKELSDADRICLGIFEESMLKAFACGWIVLDELHLTAIAVHPCNRRKGLGKKILLDIFNKAIQTGAKKATLEVSQNNFEAIALYKKFGFLDSGIRKNYYQDGANALIQWTKLF